MCRRCGSLPHVQANSEGRGSADVRSPGIAVPASDCKGRVSIGGGALGAKRHGVRVSRCKGVLVDRKSRMDGISDVLCLDGG